MEVARIAPISPGALMAWRMVGFVGLPVVVLIAGAMVYVARRD
jgi:hypothetical protein